MGRRKTPTTGMSSFTVKPPFPSVTHLAVWALFVSGANAPCSDLFS